MALSLNTNIVIIIKNLFLLFLHGVHPLGLGSTVVVVDLPPPLPSLSFQLLNALWQHQLINLSNSYCSRTDLLSWLVLVW